MSRGQNYKDLDVFIEKINKKIAVLLGKKPHKNHFPHKKGTSNKTFIFLITSVFLLLWFTTGFYYLSEDQTGIVITDGKIAKTIDGMRVGFVWPYPFSDIEIVDTAVSDFIKTSTDEALDNYVTISKDLAPIAINAKFSYQVVNARLLFLNILQKNDNLNDVVKFQIWSELHKYMAMNTKDDIAKTNLTVMSSEVKSKVNQVLANLGLNVVKLQIDAIDYSGW